MRPIGLLLGENVGVPTLAQPPEPPSGLDCVGVERLEQLRPGDIGELPEHLKECLTPEVRDRVPDEAVAFIEGEPVLALVLLVVGAVAVVAVVYRLIKRSFVAALVLAAVAGAAWWWLLIGTQ